jgi:hypothetical protein
MAYRLLLKPAYSYSQPSTEDFHMSIIIRSLHRVLPAALSIFVLAACGDGTGVDGPQSVALNFQVGSTSPQMGHAALADGPQPVAGPPMVITGTNGTLTIDEIRLIVAEVELDGEDDACQTSTAATDGCADFEAPPRFLDLPLDGEPVEAFVGLIPPGVYDELEFEIEDLEDDEADSQFAAEIAALRLEILSEFPDWPRKGTALVVGTFESAAGSMDFRVYIEAEIEIERALMPPLVVGEGGAAGADLTVDIRPDIWFTRADGSLLELHLYDYDTTGQVLEFELEIEDGILEIEIDR